MIRLIASVSVALLLCLPAGAESSPPVVAAPAGKVQGEAAGDIRAFKGIPYAVPPVGPMRWKPPLPLPKWNG